jgi:dihydroorotase
MPTLLIRGGRLISPASPSSPAIDATCDLAIADGKIAAIGQKLPTPPDATVIDAQGCIVAPGLIDPHVHLRDPGQEHKETIETGTAAAVAGGFTSICCMPNTSPALDTPELIRYVHDRAARSGLCRVFAVGAATKGRKGEELAEIDLMRRQGAVGFSDDGDCIASAGMMARVLGACQGSVFMQHAQDPTLTRGAAMHSGSVSSRLGLGGWPRVAEEIIVERDIRLNASIRARYHVQHISSGNTVELIRRARAAGMPVSGEASPHHLLLTHEACDNYNTLAKVNPPLREDSDRLALAQGVADGTITVLATDHAPHSDDEKSLPFEEAPFGLVGLETALPLYIEALVRTGAIDWPRLIALLTIEPARLCNLDQMGLGSLAPGAPADITIIDPDLAWTIDADRFHSRSRNSPFLGRAVKGRAIATIVDGRIRHQIPRA